jgi:hypothetical protein
MKSDGNLAQNIDFEVANFEVHGKTSAPITPPAAARDL